MRGNIAKSTKSIFVLPLCSGKLIPGESAIMAIKHDESNKERFLAVQKPFTTRKLPKLRKTAKDIQDVFGSRNVIFPSGLVLKFLILPTGNPCFAGKM